VSFPLLLLALLSFGLTTVVFLVFRGRTLLFPGKIYALLFIAHIAVPTLLLGLGQAPRFVNNANEAYLVSSILFSWTCLLGTTLGATFAARLRLYAPAAVTKTVFHWRGDRTLIAVGFLVLATWATRAYVVQSDGYFQLQRATQGELEGPLYAAIRMVEQFGMFANVLLSAYTWGRKTSPSARLVRLVMVLTACEFMYWLPSGRKEDTILSVLLPVATRHLLTGYRPTRRAIVIFATFVALFFPLSHYYRLAIEFNLTNLSADEALSLIDLASSSAGSAEVDIRPTDVVFNRVSLLEPISASMRLVSQGIWPLLAGQSYAEVLLTLVPRVAWAGKPEFHYGNDFGHAAGYLGIDDEATSISVTYFGEAFLNFSWLGGIAMFAIAFIFTTLYKLAAASSDRITGAMMYLLCLPSLLYLGGTFTLYFGGLLKILPFFYLICCWIRERKAP
jgi:hypothetical protein